MPIRTLISLACLFLLCAAAPAGAEDAEPTLIELPGLEVEEELAEAGLEEECEEVEEGFEECEEANEGEASGSRPQEECLLRSASARTVAYAEKNQLKLTIGYTTFESADATITFRKGSLRLGSVRRHLGKSGVVRLTKRVPDGQMAKLEAADRLSVQLSVAGVPASCNRVGNLSPRLVLFPAHRD